MKDVLPSNALWLKDSAVEFNPKTNSVVTAKGDLIKYDFLLIATGLKTNYDQVKPIIFNFLLHN